MKRYWLFSGNTYYPLGGVLDFTSDHDSISECVNSFNESDAEWCHVFDSKNKVVVYVNGITLDKCEVHKNDVFNYTPEYKHLSNLFPLASWDDYCDGTHGNVGYAKNGVIYCSTCNKQKK